MNCKITWNLLGENPVEVHGDFSKFFPPFYKDHPVYNKKKNKILETKEKRRTEHKPFTSPLHGSRKKLLLGRHVVTEGVVSS